MTNQKWVDNHYALENTVYPDLSQSSVGLTCAGGHSFVAALLDQRINEVSRVVQQITTATGTANFIRLRLDLVIGRTGPSISKSLLSMGMTGKRKRRAPNGSSDSQGDGRGPSIDDGAPLNSTRLTRLVTRRKWSVGSIATTSNRQSIATRCTAL